MRPSANVGRSLPGEASVVELGVAARATMVAAVRAMAAHLAGQADFDVDTIADLRLAVDEACNSLIELAAPGATLSCVFTVPTVGGDQMHVEVATVTRPGAAGMDTGGFGWQLLRALTDEVELVADLDRPPGWVAIRFTTRTPWSGG